MSYKNILIEREGSIVTVRLNRPSKLNAMSAELIQELMDFMKEVKGDNITKTIIFTGSGRAFSGGADMEALENMVKNPRMVRNSQISGHEFMSTLENLEQITFAAINGPCAGAGLALAMACDFRIMSDKTYLSIPEAAVGMFFTWGCTPRLVSLIGPSATKEMIMTCDPVDAETALRIGLVNKITSDDQLINTVNQMAAKIESKAPLAIRMTKKIANASAAAGFGNLYLCEPELVEHLYCSKDPMEGHRAFIEKRKPGFTGE